MTEAVSPFDVLRHQCARAAADIRAVPAGTFVLMWGHNPLYMDKHLNMGACQSRGLDPVTKSIWYADSAAEAYHYACTFRRSLEGTANTQLVLVFTQAEALADVTIQNARKLSAIHRNQC